MGGKEGFERGATGTAAGLGYNVLSSRVTNVLRATFVIYTPPSNEQNTCGGMSMVDASCYRVQYFYLLCIVAGVWLWGQMGFDLEMLERN